MNDHQKEAFSALFDGEIDEFELRRLLAGMDDEALSRWRRYQLIRDAANRSVNDSHFAMGKTNSIAALLGDDAISAPAAAEKIMDGKHVVTKESYLKPVTGFAVAATIAFVTVLGIQALTVDQTGVTTGFIANGNVSASQLPITGAAGLNQVSGTTPVLLADEIGKGEMPNAYDDERFRYYMQQHAQHASFNNGRGLLPMARLASEDY